MVKKCIEDVTHCPTIFPSDVPCFQLLGSKRVAAETQRAVKSLPNPGSLPYLPGNQTCGNRQFPSANEFPGYKPPCFFLEISNGCA